MTDQLNSKINQLKKEIARIPPNWGMYLTELKEDLVLLEELQQRRINDSTQVKLIEELTNELVSKDTELQQWRKLGVLFNTTDVKLIVDAIEEKRLLIGPLAGAKK